MPEPAQFHAPSGSKVHLTRTRGSGILAVIDLPPVAPASRGTHGCDDAYLLTVGLRGDDPEADNNGELAFFDLRSGRAPAAPDLHRSLQFYLPRAALSAASQREGGACINELAGPDRTDPVLSHLGSTAMKHLDDRAAAGREIILDDILHAVCAHVAKRYGKSKAERRPVAGALADWQLRTVKNLMLSRMESKPSLALLSKACGLSNSHFTRAFRKSTGQSPHRWLMVARVERAKEFLCARSLPLAEIALRCGFADQGHFCRVFLRFAGVSPGAWSEQ
ncbi:MAG: AraC family transcriptional regulator [Rhizomicrobium sp.]